MWSRRVELICGALGGTLGLVALGVALLAPVGTRCVSTTVTPGVSGCTRVNLVEMQGLESLSFAIILFGGLSLGVLLFAVGHALVRSLPLLVLLWVCAILLWVATVLALLSIGLFFVPADLLAIAASIAGTVAAGRRLPAQV